MSTPPSNQPYLESAQYQADLKKVEDFDNREATPPVEGLYDRVLGVSRNAKTGELEAVLRTKPDDNGQTRLFVKFGGEIRDELYHDNNAQISPGFYDVDMTRAGKKPDEISDFHQEQ